MTAHPTLVLLHSLGTDAQIWRPQRTALQTDYTVLTPISHGHGGRTWSEYLTLDDWVADIDAVTADVAGPLFFVGLSMGGVQAIEYALRRPDRVTGLVLADTFAGLDPEVGQERVASMRQATETLGMDRYADRYLTQTLVNPVPNQDRSALRSAIAGVAPQAYVASAQLTFLTDHRPDLAGISAPTLVLVGADDQKSPLALAEDLTEGLPDATLTVIPNAGHLSNVENPEAFTEAVRSFVAITSTELEVAS